MGSNPSRMSASPWPILGDLHPMSTVDSTTPPRWAMPWISPEVTGSPWARTVLASRVVAVRVPWPPTPVMNILMGVMSLI